MRQTLSLTLGLLAILLCAPQAGAARKRTRSSEEKPIITIKSNAYNEVGPTNSFGLILGATETDYFDIDAGFGLQEMEVEPWYLDGSGIAGTYKSLTVSEEGEIRIYGDPLKIDMLQLQGGYITEIDMTECVNLEVLDLSHNSLRELDLTPFTNLYALYLSDNPFTKETPLKVGAPKDDLAILEIDIVDHLDQSFNLSDYPALQVFDAYHNIDLWNLDPTGCPELLSMSLEMTNVSSLDVSRNPKLFSLNISETRIADIDLSHNQQITRLLAEHTSGVINTTYHLNGIDLTSLPNLTFLTLGGNRLKDVDLSGNPKLFTLNLSNNNLTSLDLSGNPDLYSITIMYNDMDFTTLPAPEQTWGEYFYLQNDLKVAKTVAVGDVIDLSSKVLRPETVTEATAWRRYINGSDSIIDPTLYTYLNGKVTFKEAIPDSVFIKYSNSLFPEYSLYTSLFKVKDREDYGKPTPTVGITPGSSSFSATVGIAGASPEAPQSFSVDFGDGALHEFKATSAGLDGGANVSASVTPGCHMTIYVYDGHPVSALAIEDIPLSEVDLRNAHELTALKINNAGLRNIDLRYNRNLRTLHLDRNDLSRLDLSGVYSNWNKSQLTDLSLAHNDLPDIDIIYPSMLKRLNLKGNRISDFSLKDFGSLKWLDISDNDISGELRITYLQNADTIMLSGNRIKRIVHDNREDLKLLDISGNCFDIETLPFRPGAAEYVYAPQRPLELPPLAPAVNLSNQNLVLVDGTGTTFVWKKADGTMLEEGTDIICDGGATRFLRSDLGKVYCELTNPGFPSLQGEDALRTTDVTVAEAPTTVVATFTTLEDSEAGELTIASDIATSVYVDWRGDGSEFIPYAAYKNAANNAYGGIRTYKDAKVTVYTYDSPADLREFSVRGIRMGEFDCTPMTGLTKIEACGAGLEAGGIKLPEAPITELSLKGNDLSEFIWADRYPGLRILNLAGNRYESFDASPFKELRELDMHGNALRAIDFSDITDIERLLLDNNRLSEIDIRNFRLSLHELTLNNNAFTFTTLPVEDEYPFLSLYNYGDQDMIDAVVSADGMTYDLASQALVNGFYETSYTWFLGEPEYDPETGVISGEILIENDEYDIDRGVTRFNTTLPEDVVCVMLNYLFPRTYLRTPAYQVGSSGVEAIGAADESPVDVYTLSGTVIRHRAARATALEGLPEGIYIIEGRKVFVKD